MTLQNRTINTEEHKFITIAFIIEEKRKTSVNLSLKILGIDFYQPYKCLTFKSIEIPAFANKWAIIDAPFFKAKYLK